MSRPDILQVRFPVDDLRELKRRAASLGLQPATYARLILLKALQAPAELVFTMLKKQKR